MTFLLVLIVLMFLIGSVLGWVAFFKIGQLNRQIDLLRKTVRNTTARIDTLSRDAAYRHEDESLARESGSQGTGVAPVVDAEPESSVSSVVRQTPAGSVWTGVDDEPERVKTSAARTATPSARRGNPLIESLQEQWMIWLGGISVSLAGIFLVRYSIEQGLLGPAARITLAIFVGLALHAAAEWFRRRNTGHYNAFAALAGGASITLYAALLAALLLYELLSPVFVFSALAAVSLATMALALLHGPVLAILGILGAYIVPLLVDTGSESIVGLYVYSLIITAAALLLMRQIYRVWLWAGVVIGAMGWWWLSLLADNADGFRGYYLFALAWLFLAIPSGDWLLSRADPVSPEGNTEGDGKLRQSIGDAPLAGTLALFLIAFGFNVFLEPGVNNAIYYWTPLVALLLLVSGNRHSLRWLAPVALVLQFGAWFCRGLDDGTGLQLTGLDAADQASFLVYAIWMALHHTVFSAYNYLKRQDVLWIAMTVCSPLAWLSLSYLLVTDLSESVPWGMASIVLGVFYLGLAALRLHQRPSRDTVSTADQWLKDTQVVWLILAGHFAYSLAVTIMVREAGLTLALAAQLVSLAWLIRRFDRPELGLLVKVVVTVIVVRLTLNPWLLTYPDDIHWSLWTYGGSTLLVALASRLLTTDAALRQWLEAATLHLLVLTLWAETRYWLYDGSIFALRFELLEFAINTAVWSTLGLVYHFRLQASQSFRGWYRFASRLLLAMATVSYGFVLLPLNPLWGGQLVAATPVLNELLLAFGFPLLISIILYRLYEPAYRHIIGYAISLTGFVFITLEIRHLWQGALDIDLATGNGELYTYTIVWMLIAIAALLAGSVRYGRSVYRGGMALLLLVVAKIFLIDMADLEGLLRVASFMGLGLTLLGLAYLYQRFDLMPRNPDEAKSG